MDCLDRFKTRMNLNGGNLRMENIMNSRRLTSAVFEDDPSSMLGIYMWEFGVKSYEDKTPIKIRMYGRAYSNANGWTAQFQTMHDTVIEQGDMLYDSVHDYYYICTESFNKDEVLFEGKLTQCNWILKWQNHKTGIIYEYPCYVINSTQYNSGEKNDNMLTYGSTQHQATLPADENTIPIKTPQRFFLDRDTENPVSYIVSQNDTTHKFIGKKGLVRITLLQCARNNDKDNIELGICDYVDFSNTTNSVTPSDDNVGIKILYDTKTITSGGDAQTYTCKLYNDLGIEVDGLHYNWNIVSDFKNQIKYTVSNNKISLSIDNDDYVDEEFKLEVSDDSGLYYSSIILKVESLL